MKRKYMIAVIALLAVVGGAWWAVSRPETLSVPVHTVTARTVRYTAAYSGKVESAESKSVYTDTACIAGEVLVKTGQVVEKGDVLFTVDAEATRQVAATLAGYGDFDDPEMPLTEELVAPVRGIVSTLNVKEGEITDTSKPCVVISSSEALQVKLSVPERGLTPLYEGQRVAVSGVAFDKEAYAGTVSAIASSARAQLSGTTSETVVDVTVALDPADIDESLRVGLSALAEILLEESANTLVVPYEAVMQDDTGREYVYLLQNGCAVKRIITTGRVMEEGFVVKEGLADGDQVITAPERITESGTAVTPA